MRRIEALSNGEAERRQKAREVVWRTEEVLPARRLSVMSQLVRLATL